MKKSYLAAATIVLVIALVIVFQNCGRSGGLRSATSVEGENKGKVTAAEISSLYAEIEELSQVNLACTTEADCEAIGLGAKACGGPTKYIVVSTLNPELPQVDALVTELDQKERAFNSEHGLMSTCEALTERMPVCQQNICQ